MRTKFKIVPFVAMLLLSLVFAPTSHAALTTVGPVDPATTIPGVLPGRHRAFARAVLR